MLQNELSSASPSELDIGTSTRGLLRRLELEVTRRLDGLLHGQHQGLVPGHGSELGEARQYAPGDDIRRIDWNITARLNKPYVRQTIAERELQTWLLIDRSSRLDFGTTKCEKRDLVLSAAAALGFLTAQDGNKIGAALIGRDSTELIAARGGRKHLMHLLHQVANSQRSDDSGVTDLVEGIKELNTIIRRRGLVAVISDFFVKPGWQDQLGVLSRRHDLVVVQVTDPREMELPDVGLILLRDPATGVEREIRTDKVDVREKYAKAAQQRQTDLTQLFRQIGASHLQLSTDSDWLQDIVNFVVKRSRNIAYSRGSQR